MLGAYYNITLYHKVRAGREDKYRRFQINGVCLDCKEKITLSDNQSVKNNLYVIKIPESAIAALKDFEISCGDIIRRGENPEVSGKGELLRLGNLLTVTELKDNRIGGATSHLKVICI